jgi:hypothetical protein
MKWRAVRIPELVGSERMRNLCRTQCRSILIPSTGFVFALWMSLLLSLLLPISTPVQENPLGDEYHEHPQSRRRPHAWPTQAFLGRD